MSDVKITNTKVEFSWHVELQALIEDAPPVDRLALEPFRTWHGAINLPVKIRRVTYGTGNLSSSGHVRVYGPQIRKDGSEGAIQVISLWSTDNKPKLPEWLAEIIETLRRRAADEVAGQLR